MSVDHFLKFFTPFVYVRLRLINRAKECLFNGIKLVFHRIATVKATSRISAVLLHLVYIFVQIDAIVMLVSFCKARDTNDCLASLAVKFHLFPRMLWTVIPFVFG